MSDKHKRCARCGYPQRLAGPLTVATASLEGVRYLCTDQQACAARRREAQR